VQQQTQAPVLNFSQFIATAIFYISPVLYLFRIAILRRVHGIVTRLKLPIIWIIFIVQGKFRETNQVNISGQILTNPNPASTAAYVIKFSPLGDVQWLKTFNTGSTLPLTTFEDIAADSSGDIYVVGSLINTMDVGRFRITSNGSSDGLFFKLKGSDGGAILPNIFMY
jgi:hypothetical protein